MTTTETLYNAASQIDDLLNGDDGALLAAMARYKANILELFGRDGLVEILRAAIDAAPHVDYYSRRSRKEIDPLRPEVNLRVDHLAAIRAGSSAALKYAHVVTGSTISDKDLTGVKAAVIHDEVCQQMATTMNASLLPHWEKAKSYMTDHQLIKNPKDLIMLLCTLFSVRISTDTKVAPLDRMCSLIVFI